MNDDIRIPKSGGTIRVFISSTFRDMHAERDVLNRVVFPELRKRCQQRGAEFIGVDLRWGVTEDEAQAAGALAVCLDEIERCRPFFVCLLGDRFGWVPPPEEVPGPIFELALTTGTMPTWVKELYRRDDTSVQFVYRFRREAGRPLALDQADALARYWEALGLVGAGDSITAREVLRGVFEGGYPTARAFFYLRKSGTSRHPAFPPALVPLFVETDPARRRKLALLKRRIRNHRKRVIVRRYRGSFAGLGIDAALLPSGLSPDDRAALEDGVVRPDEWPHVSGPVRELLEKHGTVAIEKADLDALAECLLDDLWRAIEPELERPAALDAHQHERAYHERLVSSHTALFRGRGPERDRVLSYIGDRSDQQILVVTGKPGAGKSAFMAHCVRECRQRHPEALVIPHFIGAAPESASSLATLRSLCETLRREAGLRDALEEKPDRLRLQLRSFLEQASARRPVALFLDGLNQLEFDGRGHKLDWLPLHVPPGSRLVVSVLPGEGLIRHPPEHVVSIEALPVDERRALATAILARRRKALAKDQLNALLDVEKRPDAGLPLYMLVALEELCLFGDHAMLGARIDSLPPTLPELFEQVLARLEHDHSRPIVEAVCAWLSVARSGLLESEVLDLLGARKPFPRIRWTRLYRALEAYLKPIEEVAMTDSTGRLDFYHDQLRFAASGRYVGIAAPTATPTDRSRNRHGQLADYFHSMIYDETLVDPWRRDRSRGLSEFPFHATHAERDQVVEDTLCDLRFIEAKCAVGLSRGLLEDYHVPHHLDSAAMQQFSIFVQNESHILSAYPWLTFQQAANTPADSAPAVAAHALLETGRENRLWIRWVNKRRRDPRYRRSFLGHTSSVYACDVSSDGQTVASAGWDGVRLWNLQSGELVVPSPTVAVHAGFVAFVPGKLFVSSWNTKDRSRSLTVFESGTWRSLETVPLPATTQSFAVSAQGNRLAILDGEDRGLITIRDFFSGNDRELLRSARNEDSPSFSSCAFSGDGRTFAAIERSGALWTWDTATWQRTLKTETSATDLRSCALSHDGEIIALVRPEGVLLYRLEGMTLLAVLSGHRGPTEGCSFSPDGKSVLTCGRDAAIIVWATPPRLPGTEVALPTEFFHWTSKKSGWTISKWNFNETTACAFSREGSLAVLIDTAAGASVHDGHTLEPRNKVGGLHSASQLAFQGHARTACAVTPDEQVLVCGTGLGDVEIVSLGEGTAVRLPPPHAYGVNDMAVSPDGSTILSVSNDRSFQMWDVETHNLLMKKRGHAGAIHGCAFAHDGSSFSTASADGTTKLWKATHPSGAPLGDELLVLGHESPVMSVSYEKGNSRIVTGTTDGVLSVWDLSTRERLRIEVCTMPIMRCWLASPSRAVAVTRDGTVHLVNPVTGETVGMFVSGADYLASAMAPDGRRVLLTTKRSGVFLLSLEDVKT